MSSEAKIATIRYLCAQLQGALAESPGGEKAWVPIRRNVVESVLAELQDAGNILNLLGELTAALSQHTQASATPVSPYTERGVSNRQEWNMLSHERRSNLIRKALEGERIGWLPHKDSWKRYYPHD